LLFSLEAAAILQMHVPSVCQAQLQPAVNGASCTGRMFSNVLLLLLLLLLLPGLTARCVLRVSA
jgi:hypothetical protein